MATQKLAPASKGSARDRIQKILLRRTKLTSTNNELSALTGFAVKTVRKVMCELENEGWVVMLHRDVTTHEKHYLWNR